MKKMKKYKALLIGLTASQLSFAAVNDSIDLGTCAANLPTVDASQCNQPNYYQTYRAAANTAINKEHDRVSNDIYHDNRANAKTTVNLGVDSLRDFVQCQSNVCEAYYETCSGAAIEDVSRRLFEENAKACIEQSQNQYVQAKGLTKVAIANNAQRKAVSTIQEKMRAIIYRTKAITLPIMENLASLSGEWASKASHLIEQTQDAGPEVQSSQQ